MGPRNRFQGMNSASLCSLVGRYDNPLPPRFLAPIASLKIPALVYILYSLPLICPHCANVPLSGIIFNKLPPNRRNFVILPLIVAHFAILFLIGTRLCNLAPDWHTCSNLAPDWRSFVILLLIGALLSSYS
jgi:hypothetical protein